MAMDEDSDGLDRHIEDAEGNWLMSYADMMTLLMSFFALMFTFSKIDPDAFDKVRKSVSQQFGGVITMPFEQVRDKLEKLIEKKNLQDKVMIKQNSTSISIVFQGSTLFEAGSADLTMDSRETISEFLDILREQAFTYPIIVEGHTDDVPIASAQYPSNWELSSDRASLVLRMLESKGFQRTNLQAQGFADTRPIAPNRDAQGAPIAANEAMNRRITIKILKEPLNQ
jgi:chemotaxis protein MotB